MAQLGRALRSGRRGRRFESCHTDSLAGAPGILQDKMSGYISGVWLSLVERYVRDVEVASSNLVTPTIMKSHKTC